MRDQHPIEFAALRNATTIERATHQQELSALRQEAATALTLAQGEARASAARLAIVEQQLRDCLAGHDPQDGNNHDKRPRTQATATSAPPAGANAAAPSAGHRPSDYGTSTHSPTQAAYQSAFTGLSTLGTPAAGAGQDNLSSPRPVQGTSGVRSQLFNNSGQPTIGQSPRPGTGVPISAGRFNSKDAAQVNNHAVLSMAQSFLQSWTVHLTGTDLTIAQVNAFIESLEKQLRTHSYDPLAMETTIAPETWRIPNAQILNSQTLKKNWKSDWRNEWDVDTFIRALKELYPSNKMSTLPKQQHLLEAVYRGPEVRPASHPRQEVFIPEARCPSQEVFSPSHCDGSSPPNDGHQEGSQRLPVCG